MSNLLLTQSLRITKIRTTWCRCSAKWCGTKCYVSRDSLVLQAMVTKFAKLHTAQLASSHVSDIKYLLQLQMCGMPPRKPQLSLAAHATPGSCALLTFSHRSPRWLCRGQRRVRPRAVRARSAAHNPRAAAPHGTTGLSSLLALGSYIFVFDALEQRQYLTHQHIIAAVHLHIPVILHPQL